MNLTCQYCQTPFTLGMAEKVAALQKMHAENMHHYDAHCPRCGRANPVSRQRLEMFTPGWQEAIKPAASEPALTSPAAPEAVPASTPEKQTASAPAKKSAAKKPAAAPSAAKAVKVAPKAGKPAAKKKTNRK